MNKKNLIILLISLIIILGGFLRFYKIRKLGTFHSDQAIELLHTLEILRGKPRLIGIKTSISEVRNGAVMYYLLIPFLLIFNYDPVAGGVLQSLLSLATIPLVFTLGKKIRGNLTGILASFLVAISPLLVSYSRQTLLAFYPLFFSALILFVFSSILEKFNFKKTLFLGFLLGFVLQIHYSTATFLLLTLITAPLFLPKKRLVSFFVFLITGFLVGFSPLLLFELRHKFFNSKMALLYLQKEKSLVFDKQYLLSFWPGVLGKLLFANQTLLGLLALIIIALASLGRLKRDDKFSLIEKLCFLQILINFIILFLFSLSHDPFRAQKAINAFVPLILLLSSSLVILIKKFFHRWQKKILATICLGLFLLNFPSFRLKENHGEFMSKGWNLPRTKKAAEIIITDLDNKNFNVAMLVDGETQGLPLRYFLEVARKKPLGVEKYGEAEVLYVVKAPEVELFKINVWELTAFAPFKILRKWHLQDSFFLYRLEKSVVR